MKIAEVDKEIAAHLRQALTCVGLDDAARQHLRAALKLLGDNHVYVDLPGLRSCMTCGASKRYDSFWCYDCEAKLETAEELAAHSVTGELPWLEPEYQFTKKEGNSNDE